VKRKRRTRSRKARARSSRAFGPCVYVLRDPRDNSIRYVGLSTNPAVRFARHLERVTDQHCGRWIASVLASGHIPVMEIVARLDTLERAQVMEMELIAKLRSAGMQLCNHTDGGETGS